MVGPARFLIEAFESRYRATPDVYRAPGRVNLIGEHTDYNLGFVLPMAVDLACYSASAPNRDGVVRVYSLNYKEGRDWPVTAIRGLQPSHHWTDYAVGVIRQIAPSRGCNIMVHSTVPAGCGLSSSASFEVSVALAAGWRGESKLELAKLCQRAENEFVGVPSGIMDQYASVFGEENAAVKIDCRGLRHETVRLPEAGVFVAVNSMVRHELGQSAYRERVAECARAAGLMGVASLRDAALPDLSRITDPVALKRARHVITENQRVEQFVAASDRGNLVEMGRLFLESHGSLRDDYQVSCDELDFLVDAASRVEGVYGARMTGGGFGGCTVNLMDASVVAPFEKAIRESYSARFGIEPLLYPVRAARGASKIS